MRTLDANDPFDRAAMLEVDAIAYAAPAITPAPQVASVDDLEYQFVRLETADEIRRNAIVTGILGPGWWYRAREEQFCARDGTVIDREQIDRLCR